MILAYHLGENCQCENIYSWIKLGKKKEGKDDYMEFCRYSYPFFTLDPIDFTQRIYK